MAKQKNIELYGEVVEALANMMFRVSIPSATDHEVLCTVSGKMRTNRIRTLVGDKVKLEVSPYDLKKGRIIQRLPVSFNLVTLKDDKADVVNNNNKKS